MKTFLLWYGRHIAEGETVDLPDGIAKRYIETNQAEAVESVVEAATVGPPQNAMRQHKPQLKQR